ncbi:MAG TPA: Gfo/Idh/MocA family oxidoreductase [Chitinophagaceae bacterium]|nr:Gfo/Idh/MocA family oxidoreductase [Chitinophagaceae bacterium]
MKNFLLIGAAGYIAPRHMRAIRETGNNLLAALDPHDSVGVLDNNFPGAQFFTEFERFDRYCDKVKRKGTAIDYLSVCSPNYLHDAHIRFGLRIGADVICEKPVVLNPWNVDALLEMEKETGRKVYSILQLRLHPAIMALKNKIDTTNHTAKYQVDLQYISARGNWYLNSWKGEEAKSGGIATNIGLHFFDMLLWIFGDVTRLNVTTYSPVKTAGTLELEKAQVNWTMSIDENDLPVPVREKGQRTFRAMTINGEPLDFSEGFEELHTKSYEAILTGQGIPLEETRKGIQLVHDIRRV